MTIAARQCREYIQRNWPDAPISRKSCRDTADGYISQHSSYGATESDPHGYDSNALDIFAPGYGRDPDSQAYIQEIVDDLLDHQLEWSIRKILFKNNAAHMNHAHVDFYPMCATHKWCNGPSVTWRYSNGTTTHERDPEPENGRYTGEDGMPQEQWEQMIDALFVGRPDEFQGDPNYWKQLDPASTEWSDFWAAFVRAISLED